MQFIPDSHGQNLERASNYLKKGMCIYSAALPRFLYKILILFISPFIELSSIILFLAFFAISSR